MTNITPLMYRVAAAAVADVYTIAEWVSTFRAKCAVRRPVVDFVAKAGHAGQAPIAEKHLALFILVDGGTRQDHGSFRCHRFEATRATVVGVIKPSTLAAPGPPPPVCSDCGRRTETFMPPSPSPRGWVRCCRPGSAASSPSLYAGVARCTLAVREAAVADRYRRPAAGVTGRFRRLPHCRVVRQSGCRLPDRGPTEHRVCTLPLQTDRS